MLGQSLGGSVAAQLAHDDRRVDAGVNLDGTLFGPVVKSGVTRPFLVLAAESHTRENEPSWKSFWDKSTGWKRELRFTGAHHGSFTDLQTMFPQIAAKLPKVPEAFPELIGTIDPDRSIAAQRAYVAAFFDLHLSTTTQGRYVQRQTGANTVIEKACVVKMGGPPQRDHLPVRLTRHSPRVGISRSPAPWARIRPPPARSAREPVIAVSVSPLENTIGIADFSRHPRWTPVAWVTIRRREVP
jgi:hypothetical protein